MSESHELPTGGTVTFLSRREWGAPSGDTPARGVAIPTSQIVGVVAHHLPMLPKALGMHDRLPAHPADVADLRRLMLRLSDGNVHGLGDEVPYSAVIARGHNPASCQIAVGRGRGWSGAHTRGLNSTRYGFGFAQHTDQAAPTAGQIAGARWLAGRWLTVANPRPTQGHRDSYNTECPGDSLYRMLEQLQPPFAGLDPDDPPEPTRRTLQVDVELVGDELGDTRARIVGRWLP